MRTKALVVMALSLALSTFALPGVSVAKKGASSSAIKLEADLKPSFTSSCTSAAFTGPEPGAEGEAERKIRTGMDQFKGTVKIPIPNSLGITEANAAAADVHLVLSHCDTTSTPTLVPYADCTLGFDEIEMDLEEDDEEEGGGSATFAEYEVDLRFRSGKPFKAEKGSCADLTTNGTGLVNGIPAVVNGDDAEADANAIKILEGEFMRK